MECAMLRRPRYQTVGSRTSNNSSNTAVVFTRLYPPELCCRYNLPHFFTGGLGPCLFFFSFVRFVITRHFHLHFIRLAVRLPLGSIPRAFTHMFYLGRDIFTALPRLTCARYRQIHSSYTGPHSDTV